MIHHEGDIHHMKLPKPTRLSAEIYMFLIVLNAISLINVPLKIFYFHEGVEQSALFIWLLNALFEVYWVKCWNEVK